MSNLDSQLNGQVYEFGRFRLDVAERLLLRAGEPVRLPPKVFDLLVVLVENNGRLLEKEELMTKVWPDSFVEEGNINRNISSLRRALDGDGDGEEFIETVPKRGYRFVAPVRWLERADEIVLQRRVQTRIVAAEEISEAEPVAEVLPPTPIDRRQLSLPKPNQTLRWKSPLLIGVALALVVAGGWALWRWRERPAAQQINAVAILPFKFLGADKADEYLGLSLTDTLITRLASLKPNSIRPTSAVLKYQKEERDVLAAGRALRVDAVLDGYVQKFGETLSVRLQLLRVTDGAILWSGEFSRLASDLLLLHHSVTKEVAQALALKLTAEQQQQLNRRYRDNVAAYEAYLKGRYFWNHRGTDWHTKAIEAFERAIAIDPQYALAYTGLADTYVIVSDHGLMRPKEAFPKARALAVRALELDESLAEAHTALAVIKSIFDWDLATANREYQRAIELDPNYALAYGWYAVNLRRVRRFDEAIALIRQAQEIDPFLLSLHVYAIFIYRDAGQYESALAQGRKVLDLDPDFWTAHYHLSRTYAAAGRYAEAVAEAEIGARLTSDNPALRADLGYALALAGRRQEARQILDELQVLSARRYVRAFFLALLHLGLGEYEQTLELLNQALEERDTFMIDLAADTRFKPLRADPRFKELLRRVGLPH